MITSVEMYRRAETSQHEADYWHKVCAAIKWAFVLALITCLCAIFYLFGVGAKYDGFSKLAHVEMVEQWRNCRQDVPCNVGPFVFTRLNPNRYNVEIAGASGEGRAR